MHQNAFLFRINNMRAGKKLFDRIILAIQKEQELKRTKKLLVGFLFLLVVSLIATPLSLNILISQIKNSGVIYFITIALSDLKTFAALWQNFSLAILESLPVVGITTFAVSAGVALFTLRLFLYKKRLLLGYLMHNLIKI